MADKKPMPPIEESVYYMNWKIKDLVEALKDVSAAIRESAGIQKADSKDSGHIPF